MAGLSYVSLVLLQALAQGYRFGFDIMDATGLPSGTVYPALRRFEQSGLVASSWEGDDQARRSGRPRRRNYQLTRAGREALDETTARYRAVSRLLPKRSRP